MSKSHKGKKFTDEHRRKIGEANKGKRLPDEAQERRRAKLLGRQTWMKGKRHTDETKRRMSESAKRRVANGWINPVDNPTTLEKVRKILVERNTRHKS